MRKGLKQYDLKELIEIHDSVGNKDHLKYDLQSKIDIF